VRDALREWSFRRRERERALEELGRLWDEGVASGDPVEGEDAFNRMRNELLGRQAPRAIG
jgi:antitoxin ParD1/3/4